jgi:hypothetical protein
MHAEPMQEQGFLVLRMFLVFSFPSNQTEYSLSVLNYIHTKRDIFCRKQTKFDQFS